MAVVALNKFRTIRVPIKTTNVGIYTCPIGVASIVILSQVTNISSGIASVRVGLIVPIFIVAASADSAEIKANRKISATAIRFKQVPSNALLRQPLNLRRRNLCRYGNEFQGAL